MPIEMTYAQARARLASLFDRVTRDRETVIIRRRHGEPVAVIAADELASLTETAHLLRSPKNARRLLTALGRSRQGAGHPETVDELRQNLGLDGDCDWRRS
jgi:antitoxin YefM